MKDNRTNKLYNSVYSSVSVFFQLYTRNIVINHIHSQVYMSVTNYIINSSSRAVFRVVGDSVLDSVDNLLYDFTTKNECTRRI